ncbi:MAG TPA: hypothetical protein VL284_18225, partial [Thermoanaerobaculia bacterium]|nr:hypothetical protein [Thermoanaerobaculia bacterium]
MSERRHSESRIPDTQTYAQVIDFKEISCGNRMATEMLQAAQQRFHAAPTTLNFTRGGEMKGRFKYLFLLLLLSILAVSAFAQGVQTATLQGTVTDASGSPLPGVT